MSSGCRVFVFLALLAACGGGPATAPRTSQAAAPSFEPVALPRGVIEPRGTLLLGDLHGTREIPAFVARLVATLAADQPVVLALELRADQLPSMPAFLASDGAAAARAAALRDPWWQDPYQDGRRSVAMFDLLELVRALKKSGARIDVACFDPEPSGPLDPERREDGMARSVIALRRARPDAMLVVYAGNLHTIRKGVEGHPGYQWMAMRMAGAGISFVTLNARYSGGTSWVCRTMSPEDCGAQPLKGVVHEPGIHLEPSGDGNYDGWFGVGAITASVPASRSSSAPAP